MKLLGYSPDNLEQHQFSVLAIKLSAEHLLTPLAKLISALSKMSIKLESRFYYSQEAALIEILFG